MLLDIIVISIVVGLLRKGTLKGNLDFKHPWIVLIVFAVQVLGTWLLPAYFKSAAVIISYFGLLLFVFLNIKKHYFKLIALGIFLNLLVIAVNGGMMPVSLEAAKSVGYDVSPLEEGTVFKQQALTQKTILGFLGDVIPLKFPIPRVISIGDIVIFIGIFLLIQDFMGKPIQIPWTSLQKK